MAGYNYRTQYFTPKARDKSRTDSLLPTAPANFTPAAQKPPMPDFSGGDNQNVLPPQGGAPNMPPAGLIDPQNQSQQKGGLYGDWKQPVFGNMPLDKFVQLTGMMANAIAPNEWSGRLGRDMANMAGQASMDRRDYEEREQQRTDLNKTYEDAQKEKRLDKALDFASKTNNLPLAKAAYGMQKKQWEEDFGVALPDWNPEQTPDIMGQIKQYREGAKELGLPAEEVKQGMAEILFGAGEITGKELLEASFPKAEKETAPHLYSTEKGFLPAEQAVGLKPYREPKDVGDKTEKTQAKAVKEKVKQVRANLTYNTKNRQIWQKALDREQETGTNTAQIEFLKEKLAEFDEQIATANDTIAGLESGDYDLKEIKTPRRSAKTKDKYGYAIGQTVNKNGKTYKYIGNNQWQY